MEHKQYVMMDYISKVNKDFDEFKLYPSFQELTLHVANSNRVKEHLQFISLNRYPEDIDDEILSLLSGKSHYVISALCLTYNDKQITIFDSSKVSFKTLKKEEIEYYINNFDVMDKAGSYNIESAENYFVKNIDGCYNNIVGLPLEKFLISDMKKILDSR